jgi:hypothetical protein
MFKLFRNGRRKAPSWSQLTKEEKEKVTGKLVKVVRAMSGARYKIVSGTDEWQRERGQKETKNEDGILTASQRGKLLGLARNAARNNATFNTILK